MLCRAVLSYSIALVWLFVFCFQVQKQELVKAGVYVYHAKDAAQGRVLFHDFVLSRLDFCHPWHRRAEERSSSEGEEVAEAGSALSRPR